MRKSIIKTLETRLGNVTVTETTVTKTNGVSLTGVIIDDGSPLKPTIYYKPDMNDDELVEFIIDAYMHLPKAHITIDNLKDKSWVLAHIIPEVINATRNRDMLKELVFKPFLDLAKVWRIDLGEGTALLTSSLALDLGISLKELDRIHDEYYTTNLDEFLFGKDISDCPLRLVSTENNRFGASAITDSDYLRQLSKDLGWETFTIIPSSIHELLIVEPDKLDIETVAEMVRDVNSHAVLESEYLSDTVYMWDGSKVVIA